ncbi:hypothetical protein HDU76_006479, partial [Blyttiomyces sp. JEL0837]
MEPSVMETNQSKSILDTNSQTETTTTSKEIQEELDHQLALVIQNEESQLSKVPPFDNDDFVAKIVDGSFYDVNHLPTTLTVSAFIQKDGNCLLRWLSWWSRGHQEQHQYWRRRITNFIKNNPKLFKLDFNQDSESIADYCKTMERDGVFGD